MQEESYWILITRYLTKEISESEKARLDAWLRIDNNKEEFDAIVEAWKEKNTDYPSFDAQNALAKVKNKINKETSGQAPDDTIPARQGYKKNKPDNRLRTFSLQPWVWQTAAMLILVCALALYFKTGLPTQAEVAQTVWTEKHTAAGQHMVIYLPDSTKVWLSSQSKLSYPEQFSQVAREVHLEGEAFFEVTHNPSRPFIVSANGLATQVLGTSFLMMAYPNDVVEVSLVAGKVALQIQQLYGERKIILSPREKISYEPSKKKVVKAIFNPELVLARKEGMLVFKDTRLAEVGRQLERWYGLKIHYTDDAVKKCLVTAQFQDETLHEILEAISFITGMQYKLTDNLLELYGKGCQ